MAFELPSLPFPSSALEPYVSAKTLDFHHGKHHKTYVDTLNRLIAGKPEEKKSLEEIIVATHHDNAKTTMFNNAAQVWNHTFFWHCMAKGGGGEPEGEVKRAIDHDFGSYEKFATEFKDAGTTPAVLNADESHSKVSVRGSGW